MPVVKIDALKNLAAAIATAIPAFSPATKIAIQQAPSAVIETFPNAAIVVPGKLLYDPAQRLLEQDLGGNRVVWNVGAHEGPIQIRITAATTIERATLEQQVIDLFMARDGSAGVLVVPITSSDAISWVAAFEYEDSQWNDTRAQEREYESIITCNAVIPALVVDSNVYQIDTLILGLTSDFSTTFTPSSFGPPLAALVQINADGSISPA